jgi:hypothetical protein|tara:strand:- start:42 stop:317 length:276 start_codon:yes stop_codon:yes gene_type:complete
MPKIQIQNEKNEVCSDASNIQIKVVKTSQFISRANEMVFKMKLMSQSSRLSERISLDGCAFCFCLIKDGKSVTGYAHFYTDSNVKIRLLFD